MQIVITRESMRRRNYQQGGQQRIRNVDFESLRSGVECAATPCVLVGFHPFLSLLNGLLRRAYWHDPGRRDPHFLRLNSWKRELLLLLIELRSLEHRGRSHVFHC